MQLLKIVNGSKRFGEKLLLDGIDITISKGDKIALVAKNGSGKTTLLKIIAGEETLDGEQVQIEVSDKVTSYYLRQVPEFHPTDTVEDVIYKSENQKIKAVYEYEKAIESSDEEQIKKTSLVLDDLKAWNFESHIKEILDKFNIKDFDREMGTLSGGQQKRVALAKMIIESPGFIILDEPTNHLDLDMIEWLEDYLQTKSLTLFMVTHDRYFLERVCTDIIELEDGAIFRHKGNYSEYLANKEIRQQTEQVRHEKAKKLYKKELEWVRRMPKARTTKAKSRVGAFDDIKKEALNRRQSDTFSISLESSRLGSKIIEAHALQKSFGDLKIVENFTYKFSKGEKVGIVGNNGVGKSTFLNLITKQIRPDGGKIVIGDTIKFGYYTQDGLNLPEDKRVLDVIRDIAEYIPLDKGKKLTAESLLETFLFPRSQQQVYVSQLSGGEKRRLYLLTVLMENPNFLILDEPTNDLDILTLNILEEYLLSFPGCLIVVTHDRYFLDKVVDHLFILEGGGYIRDYNGLYMEYRAEKQELLQAGQQKPNHTIESKTNTEVDRARQKQLKNKVAKIERTLADLQVEKDNINTQFLTITDVDTITDLSKKLQEIDQQLEELEMEWMEASEEMEKLIGA